MRGKQSAGAISTIRSVSTPPRAVKSSVRLGERKAARHCLDPRETLLFLCLKSPASCHLAPVSSLFSHTCSSSRSHCPGHVSKKKGGSGRGEEGGRETHTNANFQKEERKKIRLVSGPVGAEELAPRGGPGCLTGDPEEQVSLRVRSPSVCPSLRRPCRALPGEGRRRGICLGRESGCVGRGLRGLGSARVGLAHLGVIARAPGES